MEGKPYLSTITQSLSKISEIECFSGKQTNGSAEGGI
jgi:hypothetical protein